jgi:hypothetical protein
MNRKLFKNNTSGYKGVVIIKNAKKPYRAQVRVNSKMMYLGFYVTAEEAAKAYDRAAIKYYGDFARLNFPE